MVHGASSGASSAPVGGAPRLALLLPQTPGLPAVNQSRPVLTYAFGTMKKVRLMSCSVSSVPARVAARRRRWLHRLPLRLELVGAWGGVGGVVGWWWGWGGEVNSYYQELSNLTEVQARIQSNI